MVQLSGEFLLNFAVTLALVAMAFAQQREQIKTLFSRIQTAEARHDTHVEKLDALVTKVSDLCARFDMLLDIGRADAIKRRSG